MLLLDAFHEGGAPMYPILAGGIALLVAAARCVPRSTGEHLPSRLLLVQELRALTLVAGGFGSLLGIVHTFMAMSRLGQVDRPQALAQGISEAINNLGLALLMTLLATLISTFAVARSARTRAGAVLDV